MLFFSGSYKDALQKVTVNLLENCSQALYSALEPSQFPPKKAVSLKDSVQEEANINNASDTIEPRHYKIR